MPSYPGFCGPSYISQSLLARPEQCMNLYPERLEVGNRQRLVLYPTPGLVLFAENATEGAACRGLFAQAGRAFAAIGTKIYELSSTGALTEIGTVALDDNPATFAMNGDAGNELFITSGDKGYIYNFSTEVFGEQVTDVTQGGMVDGYFLGLDAATSTLKVSDLLDGTTWSGLNTLQRSAAPDPWQAMVIRDRTILLFGSETTEPIYDAGTSPMPFAPVPGIVIPYGIAAPFSAKTLGASTLWLARSKDGDRQVVQMNGYNVRRVSTHAVEMAFSRYDDVSDAVAFTYQDQGHQFYELNFPLANATWVYDLALGMWHERGHWDSDARRYQMWGPQYHCHAFNKHLVGDVSGAGRIFEMNIDLYTDVDGNGLRRQRVPPIIENEQNRLIINKFQLHCDVGIGLQGATRNEADPPVVTSSDQGYDPQIMMQLSTDGGETWSEERWRSAGKLGEYQHRAQWWRCGSGRNVIIAVAMTDPVPWRIVDAIVEAKGAMH